MLPENMQKTIRKLPENGRKSPAKPACVQGDRYSLAYFANARASTLFQGPQKKYPPITFPEILAQKKKYRKSFMKLGEDEMTDEEYFNFQKNTAIGPEFDIAANAAALQPAV